MLDENTGKSISQDGNEDSSQMTSKSVGEKKIPSKEDVEKISSGEMPSGRLKKKRKKSNEDNSSVEGTSKTIKKKKKKKA
jgi:hypothetical protein